MKIRSIAFFAALSCVASALAQPASDSCTSSTPITGYGLFPFDCNDADTDGLANGLCLNAGQNQIDHDVWFCWIAQENGPVLVTTCNLTTMDSKLAVYESCGCPEGDGILACNDDSCGLQSRVTFNAVSGISYMIRVGAYPGSAPRDGAIEVASGILGGPLVNPANGHTYFIFQPSSWTAAEQTATSMGGHLVTINDAEENEWVRVELANFGGADRRVWLGFNDVEQEGNFVWTSGQTPGFTNWNAGEPNNAGGIEHYAELFGSNGLWNDQPNTPSGVVVYGTAEIEEIDSCPGDVNGDSVVDLTDLATLLSNFGLVDADRESGDLDGNGVVDLTDLAILLSNFGASCP